MTPLRNLVRAAGLGLCVVAFAGSAAADPGNGNGEPAVAPPGQEQKEQTPAAVPGPAPQAAQGQEQKTENQPAQAQNAERKQVAAARKAAPKPVAPQASKGQAKKAEQQAKKAARTAAKPATPNKGRSAEAHHHVIVCHATGSESNPYVVINIPLTAWRGGHSGHGDKLLKDPASRPGSKDGFDKSACESGGTQGTQTTSSVSQQQRETGGCPASTTTTEQVLVGVWHATGAYKNGERKFVFIRPNAASAHFDRSKHEDDRPVYETRTVTRTTSGENCETVTTSTSTSNNSSSSQSTASQSTASQSVAGTQAAGGQAPAGGVAGAVSPAGAGSPVGGTEAADTPAGGVLGAVASAPESIAQTARGNLPFTGIPLWIAALLGASLLSAGLVLRRVS